MSPSDSQTPAELAQALKRYRCARRVACGLTDAPCTKADLDEERAAAKNLTERFGCQFIWPYNEPFDPATYHRARSDSGREQRSQETDELRIGMVVLPEIVNRMGWTAAHGIVEPLPA